MKASKPPHLIGVAAVLLCVAVSSMATLDDYVTTHLDDPLQPVWDKLDSLPEEVSDAVIRAIRAQFSMLNRQLENKVRPLTNTMSSVTASLNHLTAGSTTDDTRGNLLQLYETNFVRDLEESVTKIERHVNSQMDALETKLKAHIDSNLLPVAPAGQGDAAERNNGVSRESPAGLSQVLASNTLILENINTHVVKIIEELGGSSEDEDTCSTLVDKVSELMGNSGTRTCPACPTVNHESRGSIMMARDCSDQHWQQPETPSGVYETFPTLDPKSPVNSYCDMGQPGAKDTGGWTVILRRRNSTYGLVNFNRTWDEYRMGFGDPGEGEWWFGLSSLHALTYRQPFEVDLLLHDIQLGTYHAQYTTFRVEDEAHDYKLVLSGFTGNLTHDALTSKHHGSPFTTWDRDNDAWTNGNCGKSNGGGWWFNNCHFTTLTAPFPTSTDRNARTIRWLEDEWLVLDDVTMKIRPFNYAQRFNAHTAG